MPLNNQLMQLKQLLLIAGFALLSACATSPQPSQLQAWPNTAFVISSQFKHIALAQPKAQDSRLHVYIEGDGEPFSNRFMAAKDPSPSGSLMLALMEQDSRNSLYLGRPCYFNYALPAMQDALCGKQYWTTARYSEAVVASMVDALRQHLKKHPSQGVTLIGHSGGGAIAMLMAVRMPEVDQLVTLAGNLDTKAWTRLHFYAPLRKSLNPAEQVAKAQPQAQLHFGGDKDDNIPPELSAALLQRLGQPMHILPNADHGCCWHTQWRELLAQINGQMPF